MAAPPLRLPPWPPGRPVPFPPVRQPPRAPAPSDVVQWARAASGTDVSRVVWTAPDTEAAWQALVDRIAASERNSVVRLLADARSQLQRAYDGLSGAPAVSSPVAARTQREALQRARTATPSVAPPATPNRADSATWEAWERAVSDARSQSAAISDALRVATLTGPAATVDIAVNDLSLAQQQARHYRSAPEVVLASPPPAPAAAGGFPWWLVALLGAAAVTRKRKKT